MDDAETPAPWSPPKVEATTGVAMQGDYPLNHRLRAEALVADAKATDPDGLVSDELIAETAKRLKAEAKAAPKPLEKMTLPELVEAAKDDGVTYAADADKAAILKAIKDFRAGRDGSAMSKES